MAIKICVTNWKGGVGKTTFIHHIGTGFHELNWADGCMPPKVLLVDLDAQCKLSISCLGADYFEQLVYIENRHTIKDLIIEFFAEDNPKINIGDYILKNSVRQKLQKDNTYETYENIDLIISHQDLILMDMNISQLSRICYQEHLLNKELFKFKFLYNIISLVDDFYDIILFDCPSNLNFITQNALFVSDFYLIPTILDKLSTYEIQSIINKIDNLNNVFSGSDANFIKTKLLGIIVNSVYERDEEPKFSQSNMYTNLVYAFDNKVFENYLTLDDSIPNASSNGLPVFGISGNSKQKKCLINVTKEMLNRLDAML